MWNENAPLELLKELPDVLNEANLARIQSVIDYDKFINSNECGYDLCGSYAPFCNGCDKAGSTPCAVAYIKMKQAQGYKVRIANQPAPEQIVEEIPTMTTEEKHEVVQEAKEKKEEKVETAPTKKKAIRIAVARKRS
jgi:hypothetical protein